MAHLLTQIFEVSKDVKGGGAGNKRYGFSEAYEKMICNLQE